MIGKKIKFLAEIYITFFKLGSFSFGGGYAMIPLIEREIVYEKKWVEKEKIVDIFAVSESLPGAIALNSSAFVGYSIAGIPGAITALLGNLTPSVIIVLTFSILFMKFSTNTLVQSVFMGIRPAIIGLILYAVYKIGKTAVVDLAGVIIMIAAFGSTMFLHVSPIPVIIFGAAAGIAIKCIKTALDIKKKLNEGK